MVQQAQPVEPLLAEAFQAGREATRDHLHTFVRRAITDKLTHHTVDVEWLQETTALLCHADTYLLQHTTHWSNSDYHTWLATTLRHLFQVP